MQNGCRWSKLPARSSRCRCCSRRFLKGCRRVIPNGARKRNSCSSSGTTASRTAPCIGVGATSCCAPCCNSRPRSSSRARLCRPAWRPACPNTTKCSARTWPSCRRRMPAHPSRACSSNFSRPRRNSKNRSRANTGKRRRPRAWRNCFTPPTCASASSPMASTGCLSTRHAARRPASRHGMRRSGSRSRLLFRRSPRCWACSVSSAFPKRTPSNRCSPSPRRISRKSASNLAGRCGRPSRF